MNRREFIKNSTWAGLGVFMLPALPISASSISIQEKLIILHTNDVHSRIEPFPMDGSKMQGKGGFSARARIIEKIRQNNPHVLLFDSGDIFQGTPYFNRFHGEPEFRLMSEMGYSAACIGNHDFDAGIENLAALADKAQFPLVCSNYNFTSTPLENKVKPYLVFENGNIKTGVYGLGIELYGLVPENLYGNTQYFDPVEIARETENILRYVEKCDFIICLSHLGYRYNHSKVSDEKVAAETAQTDLILGGHTHTFMQKPEFVINKKGKKTWIFQNGWGGVVLGYLEIGKDKTKRAGINTINSLSVC